MAALRTIPPPDFPGAFVHLTFDCPCCGKPAMAYYVTHPAPPRVTAIHKDDSTDDG